MKTVGKMIIVSILALVQSVLLAGDNPLLVSRPSKDFASNPELLQRVKGSPHGYFRFINIAFSAEVCKRFENILISSPTLHLHGGAHLGQYAVTDLGRGLTDFGDSRTGPGLIDIMRFGVSLRLACRQLGWENESSRLFDEFLRGYRMACDDPKITVPEPMWAAQKRAKFTIDREKYFKWVKSITAPMPAEEKTALIAAAKPYVQMMLAEDREKSADYFKVVDLGYLHMGIGSALDMKYVMRIRGKTDAANDDVVLELKEVRDISGIPCINAANKVDPFRVLLGQARIAYTPFNHLGYFFYRNKNFWVHSWVDNYKEVDISKSFESIEMLREIVYDVGVQLGKGHVKHIAAPFDLQLRKQQMQVLAANDAIIHNECKRLEQLTIEAWKLFCVSLGTKGNE